MFTNEELNPARSTEHEADTPVYKPNQHPSKTGCSELKD